jgi:hypothetical protein
MYTITEAKNLMAEAVEKWEAARKAAAAAKTNKARKAAWIEVEFWGNKMAFMDVAVKNLESGKW